MVVKDALRRDRLKSQIAHAAPIGAKDMLVRQYAPQHIRRLRAKDGRNCIHRGLLAVALRQKMLARERRPIGYQPFSPVSVTPCTKYCCVNRKMMATLAARSIPKAMISSGTIAIMGIE